MKSEYLCEVDGPELECLSKLPGAGPTPWYKKWGS
jgi:hypothetical protein